MVNRLQWNHLPKTTPLFAISLVLLLMLVCFYTLHILRVSLIEARKHEVNTVLSMAKHYSAGVISQEQAGELTLEEAEQQLVDFLSGLRDGKSRYVWANDGNAFARVHVRPHVLGRFQKSYTRDMSLLQEQDPVFIVTTNVKPGDDVRVLKINGVTRIPVWNWTVGFGIYMDEFNTGYWHHAGRIILAFAGVIFALILMFWWLFRKRDDSLTD
ncbi:Methyl-accepting chemotaxis protein 4 [Vibrio aerogenes CECT 7868]|uniref:Methyl-accepting chemotaxis protein 4 n=1 Tax=Vibrio aerogenes CECT 7868 TaxID=1216006 RepID=A0A1M6EEF9_9VIBR|nr:cache domain-containing protein [Vibrio aerogenes]SHI83700.1 Methyl-accepting chemotaxis protein 4 [Vibrio aerogenes CECT 7868]